MSLSDIMSGADLTALPQAALIIFFLVFASVTARVFLRADKAATDAAARLPLDDTPRP